MHIIMSTG